VRGAHRAHRPKGGYPWLGPAVFTGSLMPLVSLMIRAAQGRLGANPIAEALNQLGLLALIFLVTTLSLTPLRRLTGWPWPIRIRRMVGLFAFFYATLHFTLYLAVDQGFNLAVVWEDITKRPFIFVGFMALLLMTPLAVTSTNGWVRRLGAPRWQRLHRLVYAVAILAAVHFLWRVKADYSEPARYAAILGALLLFRVWDHWTRKCGRRGERVFPGRRPLAERPRKEQVIGATNAGEEAATP
jgi:sulfoxide reductase heme-binding subunit YedZ